MNKAGQINSINPQFAIEGGEVAIMCEGLNLTDFASFKCYFDDQIARIIGVSTNRVLAIVPENLENTEVEVFFENSGERSNSQTIVVGKKIAEDLHIVANPAVDPKDDSIILTRSGSRGQQYPITLFRLETDGFLSEMTADVMNPTGIAFDQRGKLFITNRADGEVSQLNSDSEAVPIVSDLGVATGIAFNKDGTMFIGDRSGTIFKIGEMSIKESWAILEPSVSAYHLAFGLDGDLYVTAPGLCSFDSIYKIDNDGLDEIFYRGLGRPQGLAFDDDGNLYVAACLQGRHGIVKISENGQKAELFVAGSGIVGLCFTRKGEMIVATNSSVYTLTLGIYGVLLSQ